MLDIRIKTIPHSKHRYETVGDWTWIGKGLLIEVSNLKDWRKEFLIGVHELVETMLCLDRGISQRDVDRFDIQYERDREKGLHSEDAEQGDDPAAPYRKEHFFATNIERQLALELRVDWSEYAKDLADL